MQASDGGVAAALRAVLHDDAVFLLSLDRDAAFDHVVAHRLFDVDVLARLRSPDGDQRVPVVGSGDGDRVDRAVFEELADVGVAFRLRLALRFLLDHFQMLGEDLAVRIDQSDDLDVVLRQPTADVGLSTPVHSSHRDPQPIVGALDLARRARPHDEQ